jgi:hypothetical protein
MLHHGLAAGVSVLLGAVIALLTNVFTEGWAWPAGLGLAVAVAALTIWEARRNSPSSGSAAMSVSRTGAATAQGRGSWANTGVAGSAEAADVRRTGDAHATDGGVANTGVTRPPSAQPD